MRLWTLNPSLLDCKGLLAVWREGLLAMAVIDGKTKGYKHHPQLNRFYSHPNPKLAISQYLWGVVFEAQSREYRFDSSKLLVYNDNECRRINVTSGQVEYELKWLIAKLAIRGQTYEESAMRYNALLKAIKYHREWTDLVAPMFQVVPGEIEDWERIT